MKAENSRPWLTILGIGDDGVDTLTPPAVSLLRQATTLIAPERVLARLDLQQLGLGACEVVPWTAGVGATLDLLETRRGTPVTMLATGDPMHFGIGATLRRRLNADEMHVIPSPSGFSLAAARVGWSLADVACISLHGRAVSGLQPHILPGNRILSLTSTALTVHEAAALLTERRYGLSDVVVLEHMGGSSERQIRHLAADIAAMTRDNSPFADFNVMAIECRPEEGASVEATVPGLPDEVFVHDGQLTKREARAVTLAALQPHPRALLWDVGAGCGSIGIEWMRAAPGARATAIESKPARLAMIAENAARLGTPQLRIIEGRAPESLTGLEAPDAVFIGGGIAAEGVFETSWQTLRPGGRLVTNAVTVEGEARVSELHGRFGGDLIRLAVSRASPVGGFRGFKPLMTVTQLSLQKPWSGS